ncbi:hypothetical protein Tco_1443182 [Tanacetum coccineum]
MVEPENPLKKKDQIALDEELALKLQAEEQAELEKERVAQEEASRAANIEELDSIQAMIDVSSFIPMDSEVVKSSMTRTEGSSKRVGDELDSDKLKKQKIDEHVEVEKDDQEEAKMKRHIEIVKDDEVEIDAIPLATKPQVIVEYKIDKDGRMGYFKLIRADGSSKRYSSTIKMLQHIDREDLDTLWKLVKARHENTRLEEDYEKVLWGDLKLQLLSDYYCWKDYADRDEIKDLSEKR